LKWFSPDAQNSLKQTLSVGDQDHRLRKRPINLEEEEDSSSNIAKKESLKFIADSLNASHRNVSIEDSFSFANQPNFESNYSQIFSQK
jgi:hypothetical protein